MTKSNIEIWEDVFQKKEWGKYPSIPVIKFIARHFYSAQKRQQIKILEIGSGTGANLWFCAREGFTVYGIEGSKTAINRMDKRFLEENLSLMIGEIIEGDFLNKLDEYPNNYFDAIIDSEALYCNSFDKTKDIVKKSFEKLKYGGVMLSITFADGCWGMNDDECDYHTIVPKVGPLSGVGTVRYTTRADVDNLYKLETNVIEKIERQEYFLTETNVIKEWVIELRKV